MGVELILRSRKHILVWLVCILSIGIIAKLNPVNVLSESVLYKFSHESQVELIKTYFSDLDVGLADACDVGKKHFFHKKANLDYRAAGTNSALVSVFARSKIEIENCIKAFDEKLKSIFKGAADLSNEWQKKSRVVSQLRERAASQEFDPRLAELLMSLEGETSLMFAKLSSESDAFDLFFRHSLARLILLTLVLSVFGGVSTSLLQEHWKEEKRKV